MADDKLKTSPESPGQDRPGDTPVEDAPSMQKPPAPEAAAPKKAEEHTEPKQSVIPGMGEDAPARPAPGEVVVDFDKINELMSQRRAPARDAVSKAEVPSAEAGSGRGLYGYGKPEGVRRGRAHADRSDRSPGEGGFSYVCDPSETC